MKEEWRYWKTFVLIHNKKPLETEWLRSISGDYGDYGGFKYVHTLGVEACVKVAVESTYCFAISSGM